MVQKDNGVEQTLTRVVMSEIRKGFEIVRNEVTRLSAQAEVGRVGVKGRLTEDCPEIKDEVDSSPLSRCQLVVETTRCPRGPTCCIICRLVPRIVLRRLEPGSRRLPLKHAAQEEKYVSAGMSSVSYS